jgi:glycine/D-amino acid oxidase-like deaminating enzyme
MVQQQTEVVIIGGGIVGCTTAYFLAKRGIPVVLCEKGEIAGEQSSRNWGFVRQQGRDPAETPLMIECNRMWQGLEKELDADLEWRQGGNLSMAYTEERLAELESWVDIARQYQLQSRILTKKQVEDFLPGIRTDCVGALQTPSDGQAAPTKVSAAFQAAAEKLGAEFYTHCAVEAIERQSGAVSGVVTEHGEIKAKTVVCAGGAWSGRLLATLGLTLPQLWMRGSVARTTPVRKITDAGVWSRVAFRQRRDGSLNIASGFGTDHDLMLNSVRFARTFWPNYLKFRSFVSLHIGQPLLDDLRGRFNDPKQTRILDPAPNPKRINEALAQLKTTFPDLENIEIARAWAGYIDFMPDMIPVIDKLDQPGGLVVATGLSGHGFGLGPIVGRVVAELIVDGASSFDLHDFRFSRFSDGSRLAPRSVI